MAGRLIASKKVFSLFDREDSYLPGNALSGRETAIEEETKEDRALERFSDDPPEAGTSLDEPYLFSPYSCNRHFLVGYLYYKKQYVVHSVYRCLQLKYRYVWRHRRWHFSGLTYSPEPYNTIILLISDGKMAVGHFEKGKLTAQRYIDGSEKHPRSFLNTISVFLKTWEAKFEEADLVFVRCTQVHYTTLFESLKDEKKKKYSHIPFVTCPPSIEEVQRVYSRLFTYVFHGNLEQALADLQQERKSWNHAKNTLEPPKKSTRAQKQAERQQYPWLDARLAAEIEKAVGRNDGDRLEEVLSGRPAQIRDYLNERAFLHYAVRQEAADSVAVLLEFGADPTVTDRHNRVPFDYCKTGRIEEIFIEFRLENEQNFEWNKAKIPAEKIVPVKEKQKEEYDKRAARDKLRSQRRQKLDKRRVKIE